MSDSRSPDAQEAVSQLDDGREDTAHKLLENERELDELKVKMKQGSTSDT